MIDFCTIIGALLSLIGIAISLFTLKRKRRPCQITYDQYSSLSLYDNLTNIFKDYKVLFKGAPTSPEICYLEGHLICTGEDINTDKNLIRIQLPKKCKWLSLNLSDTNSYINAKFKIDNKNESILNLSFDSIRRDERIIIRAIIKNDNKYLLSSKDISFSHRIKNTDEVIVRPPLYNSYRRHSWFRIYRQIIYLLIFILNLMFLAFSLVFDVDLKFVLQLTPVLVLYLALLEEK